jgi:hypothetical protein
LNAKKVYKQHILLENCNITNNTYQKISEIIQSSLRAKADPADQIINSAFKKCAEKYKMSLDDLKRIPLGKGSPTLNKETFISFDDIYDTDSSGDLRRNYIDDLTVIVLTNKEYLQSF